MSVISHREYTLFGVDNGDLNRIVKEIKTFLDEGCLHCALMQDYIINIYKDNVVCCGHFPIGIIVEIEGPKKEPIDNWDSKIYSKIIEICIREGIKHDDFQSPEILYLSASGVPTPLV
jgi:hypothetical protein